MLGRFAPQDVIAVLMAKNAHFCGAEHISRQRPSASADLLKMPFARIDNGDITFYYTDSGLPAGVSDYTTIVLIHGATINGAIFERMTPYAAQHGLRLLAVNMRGYAGSTPYTAEELSAFTSDDAETQASALRNFGREFAGFLVYACATLGIPQTAVHDGKITGGIAILTWSLSTGGLLALLGDPQTLIDEQTAMLRPYLHTAFAFDPPSILYGDVPSIGLISPLRDPAVPASDKAAAFGSWVSGYYTAVGDIAQITPETLRARTEEQPPTLHTMSTETMERIVEPENLVSCNAILKVPQSVYAANLRRAVLNADVALPNVKFVALWCDRTIWMSLWSAKVLAGLLQEITPPGWRVRETVLVKIDDANHIYQWDRPEGLVQILRDNM